MKYCEVCRGPLREVAERDCVGVDGCRLCWLDLCEIDDWRLPHDQSGFFDAIDRRDEVTYTWVDDQENANDTAASPATSQWLPRVWVDGSHIRLSGDVINGDVVFFRYHDAIEVPAASTQLAKILRDEAADVAEVTAIHNASNYINRGCRCAKCRAAHAAQVAARRAARAAIEVPEGVEHGTVSTYNNWRCRCEACAAANHKRSAAQYARAKKAKR